MIRVLIADDHPIVRRGLRDILGEEPGFEVVSEAQNASDVLKYLSEPLDVLLLDITMPGRNGLEVLKDVKRLQPALPVLMISIHPEDQYALRALKAGANGYLTKESAPEELIKAIHKVLEGGKYVSTSMAERLALGIKGDSKVLPHEALSNREYEILRLIASGKSPTDIAGDLSLSIKTVSTYRARILEKMGMRHNAELTRYALENKLVE